MTPGVENYELADAAQAASVSTDTIRRAVNKHRTGSDDESFPPPLRAKRKGARGFTVLRSDLLDWLDRWPDA